MSSTKVNGAHWLILPALGLYVLLCLLFNFTQDDAYISYRYVANYLNGDGLVYNIGQRIEGFTNFGWTIWLALWGALGADFIVVSRVTGFVMGGAFILLTYLVARLAFSAKHVWLALVPLYLVAANQSLAYWSSAGLETAAFAALTMLALYLFLKRSWGLMGALFLAVWVRPEGAVVAGVLILTEAVVDRRFPWYALRCAVAAFLLSLPYLAFKILYYGSIFPNPFYAKTGWNVDQLVSGLEYAGRFLSHYGFYGAGFVVSLVAYRRLNAAAKSVWWFSALYVAYVVLIGGDVLKVHRFFVPVSGGVAIVTTLALWVFVRRLARRRAQVVALAAAVALVGATYILPRDFVKRYYVAEKALVGKMSFLSSQMKQWDATDFSVALSTIGVFGYTLVGHNIIDMLGLTDSTIARHSEDPIPGMVTTWKEQKHNSRYLLTRAPDYFVFSTGSKPSAPAERALLLYDQFFTNYLVVAWAFQPSPKVPVRAVPAFKRMHPVRGPIVPTHPVEYVQYYSTGLSYAATGNFGAAIENLNRAILVSPKPVNPTMACDQAHCCLMSGQHKLAQDILSGVLSEDSMVFQAHMELHTYAQQEGDTTKANLHRRWLSILAPWYLAWADSR